MGALPWPIVFAAVISLFFLKLMGNASLNEANVTHTIMSAGAMVAGGLAFTIPGAWMLGYADQISWLDMFIVALAGTILGLLATALIHRHFIVDAALEFPTGNAAAQTLRATEAGGKTGKQLFGSMAIAGIYSVLRDALGVVSSMLCTLNIPGVTFAIYNSPMLLSVGFLVGFAPVAFWFAGAAGQLWHHRGRHRCRSVRHCDCAGHRQVPGHGPHDGLWRRRRPQGHPAAGRRYRPRSCRR